MSGVLQGSVLGPLLFLVFIDDVYEVIKSSFVIKYADDMKLAIAFDADSYSQQQSCGSLQEDLAAILNLSHSSGLTLNAKKMCISSLR